MTQQEFKAWFDGFTEAMDGAPNKKQWERIKARVKEIDGVVTTYPVFVEPWYVPPYWAPPFIRTCDINIRDGGHIVCDAGPSAMTALGKADYSVC